MNRKKIGGEITKKYKNFPKMCKKVQILRIHGSAGESFPTLRILGLRHRNVRALIVYFVYWGSAYFCDYTSRFRNIASKKSSKAMVSNWRSDAVEWFYLCWPTTCKNLFNTLGAVHFSHKHKTIDQGVNHFYVVISLKGLQAVRIKKKISTSLAINNESKTMALPKGRVRWTEESV